LHQRVEEEEGTVPQVLLPLIPDGSTSVNDCLSIVRENGQWTYFYGLHPVFAHAERDRRSFRMFSAQLVVRGMCKQADIMRTFGVSKNSVKRSVKKYREQGIEAFYRARQGRGGTVMKEEVITRAQVLLSRDYSWKEVAGELGIKYDTLRKAIEQGRLRQPPQAEKAKRDFAAAKSNSASDKSERSVVDAVAEMGTGLHASGGKGAGGIGYA
jgi:transposase